MTLERVNELKIKYQKETEYYRTIGFDILQRKFQDVEKIIEEIEEVVKENERLKTKSAEYLADKIDCEVCNL